MNPTPNPSQEPLRDARLAMAWQHMPDAHMLPSDFTRQSVLQAGKQAVKDPSTVGAWWQRLTSRPHHRSQWSAALASVLVASFITVTWYGTSTPDANPEEAQVADLAKESRVESSAAAPAAPAAAAAKPAQAPTKQAKIAPIDTQADKAEVAAPAQESVAAVGAAAPSESMSRNEAALARSATENAPVLATSPAAPMAAAAPAAAKASAAGPSMDGINTSERKRGDAPASSGLVVTLDGQPAKINAQQASQLLDALHALPYESFDEASHRSNQQVTLTVLATTGEVWRIASDRVEARSTSTAPVLVIHINPEQYQLLRRLAGSESAP